ncbi:MAG: hypothetical protein ACK4ML_07580, partial [Alishewanella aestuarii]
DDEWGDVGAQKLNVLILSMRHHFNNIDFQCALRVSLIFNAAHMGDDRIAVGIPATEGSERCALLAATNTQPTRHCRQAMPNNGNLVHN